MSVTLKTNGNPFWYGAYMVALVPNAADVVADLSTDDFLRLSQYPNALIHANRDCEAVLEIPFYNLNYMNITSTDSIAANVQLFFLQLVPFSTVGGDTLVDADLTTTVYASFRSPELSVATRVKAAFEMGGKEEKGLLSSGAYKVQKVMKDLSSIPIISGVTSTVASVAGAVGDVAKFFGWSKPAQLDAIRIVQISDANNAVNTDGIDNGTVLALSAANQHDIRPQGLNGPEEDQMCFAYSNRRWNIIDTIVWAGDDDPEDIFYTLAVNPCIVKKSAYLGVSSTRYQYNSLGYNILPFRYWRGSIEYRITAICSEYHRGKYRIWYQPSQSDGVATTTYTVSSKAYNAIIDLATTRTVTLRVPYTAVVPFNYVNGQGPQFVVGTTPSLIGHGLLHFDVINRLTCPKNTADAYFIVEMRAGEDFQFASPSIDALQELNTDPPVIDTVIQRTDAISLPGNAIFGPPSLYPSFESGETTHLDLFKDYNSDGEVASQCYFGETVLSARELVKRVSISRPISVTDTDVIGAVQGTPLIRDGFSPGIFSYNEEYIFTNACWTFYTYYRRMFLFDTGGVRYKITTLSPATPDTFSYVIKSPLGGSPACFSTPFVPFYTKSYQVDGDPTVAMVGLTKSSVNGTLIQYTGPDTRTTIEFAVPQVGVNYGHKIIYRSQPTDSLYPQEIYDAAFVQVMNNNTVDSNSQRTWLVSQGGADDYSCYIYTSAPPLYKYGTLARD
jgi:hypothetical protein